VGKRALEGLDGVKKVKSGFKNGREINRVTYNPSLITIEEMVDALKDAKTYRGTVEDDG
jgi:copper chaperone CopZ